MSCGSTENLNPSRCGSPCKRQVRHMLISELTQIWQCGKGRWYKTRYVGEERESISKGSHDDKTLRGFCKASSYSVRDGYLDVTLH